MVKSFGENPRTKNVTFMGGRALNLLAKKGYVQQKECEKHGFMYYA